MPRQPQSTSHPVEILYHDHHTWLAGWLRHKLGNVADAADLTQDTFLRILAARDAAQIREPRRYLVTIARGLVIDLFRRRSLEAECLAALAARPEASWPSEETRALIVETLMEIDAMLEGLGAGVRQVFILSQFNGLTYAEIAARLGISLRAVNKYMACAIEHCCLYQLQAERRA